MSYLQAFVIAVIQGVTELFPVSSLGHSVLIPALRAGDRRSRAAAQRLRHHAGVAATPGANARPAAGRQRAAIREAAVSDARIARLPYRDSLYIGVLQIAALLAGISRSGITMAGGLWRGLDHEDAARFAFLLATPPILSPGVLNLPPLPAPPRP